MMRASGPFGFGGALPGRAGLGRAFAAHTGTDFSYLVIKILRDDLMPDGPAFAVFIGAVIQAGQLFAARPNQLVQPHQLSLQFDCTSFLAFH